MASSKEYKEYILEQLFPLGEIECRPMMGEYLLKRNGKLFGGIYDDRFLVKKTKTNEKFRLREELPNDGAKPMYVIEDVDDREKIAEIVLATCDGLR